MRTLSSQPARVDRSFERLYRRHRHDVYRYALGVLANPADAEDVTQTAFLNVYRAFQKGDRPDRPLTWLIAIAHNVCRQRFRQSARRPQEVALDVDVLEVGVHEKHPAAADIKVAFNQLTFNQRSALALRELEGRSYAEIADMLGLSLSAVETLIFRARRALREQLEVMLSCSDAERAISRQLDGTLERADKGPLRAHLRACPECASVARKVRAQRSAPKSLLLLPLPPSPTTLFGGSAATGGLAGFGSGLALKAAAVAGVALFASGVSYEATTHKAQHTPRPAVVFAQPGTRLADRRPPAANRQTPATTPRLRVAPPTRAAALSTQRHVTRPDRVAVPSATAPRSGTPAIPSPDPGARVQHPGPELTARSATPNPRAALESHARAGRYVGHRSTKAASPTSIASPRTNHHTTHNQDRSTKATMTGPHQPVSSASQTTPVGRPAPIATATEHAHARSETTTDPGTTTTPESPQRLPTVVAVTEQIPSVPAESGDDPSKRPSTPALPPAAHMH